MADKAKSEYTHQPRRLRDLGLDSDMSINRIVLTGGPGGGKTTLMRHLLVNEAQAHRWLLVPEAAPLLFQAGLNGREKSFQRSVVQLQIALEDTCASAAQPGQFLLCHRGALDPLAYWIRNGWDEGEFFAYLGCEVEWLLKRYAAVIHLETAASGALPHYKRYPDAHRPETPEQAFDLDRLCYQVWKKHPRFVALANDGLDWELKAQKAIDLLSAWSSQAYSETRPV